MRFGNAIGDISGARQAFPPSSRRRGTCTLPNPSA